MQKKKRIKPLGRTSPETKRFANGMIRTQVGLSDEAHARVRSYAAAQYLSMSEVLNGLCIEHLPPVEARRA